MSPALAGRFFTTRATWEGCGPLISGFTCKTRCWGSREEEEQFWEEGRQSWGISVCGCRSAALMTVMAIEGQGQVHGQLSEGLSQSQLGLGPGSGPW